MLAKRDSTTVNFPLPQAMPYDPTLPLTNSPLESQVKRSGMERWITEHWTGSLLLRYTTPAVGIRWGGYSI